MTFYFRSPDDSHPGHHRLDPSRSGLDVSGAHFSRSEASSHHVCQLTIIIR